MSEEPGPDEEGGPHKFPLYFHLFMSRTREPSGRRVPL